MREYSHFICSLPLEIFLSLALQYFISNADTLLVSVSSKYILKTGFENMTEKEVKEFIYRQELAKQIDEKNKLKEEMKRKEAEEEAKIEAKIKRDLEKIRRQYEEEQLQRLELAIRVHFLYPFF